MKQNKFLFGQDVWCMKNDLPTKDKIKSVEYLNSQSIYLYTLMTGGYTKSEGKLFASKEELMDSLFN